MKKIISLILIIISIMALSSCLKNSDYDYYVEVYDAKTIVGEDDFYKFYLDTQNKKETSIKIVKTFLLNKETCSNEFYEQNKDEYPKTFEIIVSYDGKKYIKQNITEKYTKTYKYLKYEKIESTNTDNDVTKETYLLTDDPNMTYEKYIDQMLSSVITDDQEETTNIYTKYYLKTITFSETRDLTIEYCSDKTTITCENISDQIKNEIFEYIDLLPFEKAIDCDDLPKNAFENNYLRIIVNRTVKDDPNDLIIFEGEVFLMYRIDLDNGLIIMDYVILSTDIHQLAARINLDDPKFKKILEKLKVAFQ